MTGTIFLGGIANRKARFAGACQDQHAGRPAPSLGWPSERKSIGATSRGKRRFSKISWWAPRKRKSVGATSQGYGAWGAGFQGLGTQAWGPEAGASRVWGPGHQDLGQSFVVGSNFHPLRY